MKKTLILIALAAVSCRPIETNPDILVDNGTDVQNETGIDEGEEISVYHPSRTMLTDLVSTKLEVSFDWTKSQMIGKETLTAKPHFYSTDSLVLDAKGMEIKSVTMKGNALKYDYASDVLTIRLDKTYKRGENYTIVIDYIAKPDERTTGGSAAITSDKGLYFINPTGEDKTKMPQIWTQGETQSNSVWFPTVDSPNAKSTQEIFITVDDKYVTLSNGKMVDSKKNPNGTRTDHWKQDLPHSTYLFMMGVGEFKVVKDSYKRPDGTMMEVNYYVEPKWESSAKAIFGETPKMIGFFSQLMGVEYPWDKYSQIVVRDYVSGAMENTGAVVFGDYSYKTERELLDGTDQSTIAHELFHHWFGDLVTAESWSNLSLNESFANYSQYLWDEHRYGIDEADYQAVGETEGYYASAEQGGYHDLIWFNYESREDMFDGHSYNKGGRILHMLRNYLGDEAFFQGMQNYLKANAYKAAEFNQLRLAFEDVSGEDLNWFFNQWYLDKGHPSLTIDHTTDEANHVARIHVEQTQDLSEFPVFKLPVDVTVYDDKGQTVHRIWVNEVSNDFEFPYTGTLKNVQFDSQQMLLAKKTETKDPAFYIHQFYNGKRYAARRDGLLFGVKSKTPEAEKMVLDAMSDPFWDIRLTALSKFAKLKNENQASGLALLKKMVVSDSVSSVRAAALSALSGQLSTEEMKPILEERIANDRSYTVITNAVSELNKIDPARAMALAKGLENEPSSRMLVGVARIYGSNGGPEQFPFFERVLNSGELQGFDVLGVLSAFTFYTSRQDEKTIAKSVAIFESQAKSGGMYKDMFMPQYIDYLVQNLNGRVAAYQEQANQAKSDGNLNAADIAKGKQSEAENLIRQFKAIPTKANSEEEGH